MEDLRAPRATLLLRLLLSALAIFALCAACKADDAAAAEAPPPTTPQPAAAPSGDGNASSSSSSGTPVPAAVTCGEGSKEGKVGDEDIKITSSGIEREAMIHVPAIHDGKRALPIVLVLHPLLLTHKDMRKLVKIEPHADDAEHGFIALFPNGMDRSWNAGECCGKAKDKKIDDVGFIKDLLAHVASKWCVDPARLYSMGFSNGAFLSHRLACELPGGVRAIVPVAGTLGIPETDCKPPHPTPVLAIHGTDDELVPFAGGPPQIPFGASFGTFISPAAADEFWTKTNGCGPANATPYYQKGEVSCVRHDECRDKATVALCTVTPGGHQWPGASSLPAMGHVTADLDATAAAVELFKAHGL
jgi:polyhydroxybutyrate depolymerase